MVRSVKHHVEKAVLYARVSTEEQVNQGVSLDAQVERMVAYCKLHNLAMTETVLEEGVSGAKPISARAGGRTLTDSITQGAKHIITTKLDRLFRDCEDALKMSRHWDRAGVALHILDMGGQAIDTSTAIGRMFLTMTAGFAEFERNQTSERTMTAMQHKKQHLQAYSPTPFGFERSGPAHEKSGLPAELSRHSHEAEVVQMMKRWDAERWTYQAIADELMKRCVPTKRGRKRWYASTVRGILRNDIHK